MHFLAKLQDLFLCKWWYRQGGGLAQEHGNKPQCPVAPLDPCLEVKE